MPLSNRFDLHLYRPQRSCEGYAFTPVRLSTRGGGLSQCILGSPPGTRPSTPRAGTPQDQNPWRRSPRDQTPPEPEPSGNRHPLASDPPETSTPRSRHPPGTRPFPEQAPPGHQTPSLKQVPRSRHPPRTRPPGAGSPPGTGHPSPTDGYGCGRYASYWNAFLFSFVFGTMFYFILTTPPGSRYQPLSPLVWGSVKHLLWSKSSFSKINLSG